MSKDFEVAIKSWYHLFEFMKPLCYICGKESEFTCEACEQNICEKCGVLHTPSNPLEKTLCTKCDEYRKSDI